MVVETTRETMLKVKTTGGQKLSEVMDIADLEAGHREINMKMNTDDFITKIRSQQTIR